MFAKTQIGFALLSLYAKAGQTIGGVTFKEDGVFSDIDLNIYDFEGLNNALGMFSINQGKNEDDISFSIKINRYYAENSEGQADYLVTLGHEFFIHMEQWHRKYLYTYVKDDKSKFNDLIKQSSKEGGVYDHERYINGNKAYKSFSTYLLQLKSLENSPLSPDLIDKAKNKHDEIYKKYRKVHQ